MRDESKMPPRPKPKVAIAIGIAPKGDEAGKAAPPEGVPEETKPPVGAKPPVEAPAEKPPAEPKAETAEGGSLAELADRYGLTEDEAKMFAQDLFAQIQERLLGV